MPFIATVLAQEFDLGGGAAGETLSTLSVEGLVSWAVTALLVVAGLIFFFMLILGGLKWILSGGDKASTEGARNQITAALIGLVVVFSAWAIATLLNTIFGIDILHLTIPEIPGATGASGGSGGGQLTP